MEHYLIFGEKQNPNLVRADHQLLTIFFECPPCCLGQICTKDKEIKIGKQ